MKLQHRLQIWWAKNRPDRLRTRRCRQGKHNPPPDKAFTCMYAVMVGGPCTECPDETAREICWIGNAWDFPGVNSPMGGVNVISVQKLTEALRQLGLQYIGDYDP